MVVDSLTGCKLMEGSSAQLLLHSGTQLHVVAQSCSLLAHSSRAMFCGGPQWQPLQSILRQLTFPCLHSAVHVNLTDHVKWRALPDQRQVKRSDLYQGGDEGLVVVSYSRIGNSDNDSTRAFIEQNTLI